MTLAENTNGGIKGLGKKKMKEWGRGGGGGGEERGTK